MAQFVPVILHEASVVLYTADASGAPNYNAPVWAGACADDLVLRRGIDAARWWPLGAPRPTSRDLHARHTIEIGRLWVIPAWPEQDFDPDLNQRFALELVWQDSPSGITIRRTYHGVSVSSLDLTSSGVVQFGQRCLFDAEAMTQTESGATSLLPDARFATGIGAWRSAAYGGGTQDGGIWNAGGWADFTVTVGGTNTQIRADRLGAVSFAATLGETFRLRFRGKASAPGLTLTPYVYQAAAPSSPLWTGPPIPLHPGWQAWHLRFRAAVAGNPNATVVLVMGSMQVGTWSVDDIQLFRG